MTQADKQEDETDPPTNREQTTPVAMFSSLWFLVDPCCDIRYGPT